MSVEAELEESVSYTPIQRMRHSAAHVMAEAVLEIFPDAKLAIGPAIEDGFYYDFDLPRSLTPEDLPDIEQRMRRIIAGKFPFVRDRWPREKALEYLRARGQDYKVELIENLPDAEVGIYTQGTFLDLCRGPHVQNTGEIGPVKLMKIAGAYWRGDEHRPMLQRIYGTAWFTQQELDAYLHRLEEAQRRDHRRLGVELDLFSFPPELGGGLSVWHPKGGLVRRIMEEYSRRVHEQSGYEFVYSPHVARSTLWETSGHLDWYADSMYPPMELDEQRYYVKPMSCPFHTLIYRSRLRSYRELPLRLFEFGAVYRYERSGVLHGLMRARGFTQDDAHIFVTEEQVVPELRSLLGFVLRVLRDFGFDTFEAKLSTRDPDKSVGPDEGWELATDALRQALEAEGIAYEVNERDAAFYGPKIDIDIRDALGRAWQLSTLQVDFNHPERFDLTYVTADNERKRPYMIHRALFGSIERFFGILVEHYAGAFPTWLAPVQVVVIPIADRHHSYGERVAAALAAAGLRAETDASNETLGNRIRKAQGTKVPYMLVVGDKEAEAGTVAIRARSGDKRNDVALETFVAEVTDEVATRSATAIAAS